MMDETQLKLLLKDKRVVYISTKNVDYIRTSQEIKLIGEVSRESIIISYSDKSYFVRFLKCFIKMLSLNMKQVDLIYVGFMAQMIVPFLSWKCRNKIIVTDFFISVFDTLVDDRKKVNASSIIGMIMEKIDRRTIMKSSYIVADTIAHKNFFVDRLGAKEEKCFVMYLEADNKIYYPRKSFKPAEYSEKFLVLYFGSILPLQGVEFVLKGIEKLKEHKSIHFLVIGPIVGKYNKIETSNVTYINWLSQEELAQYIGYADLCLGGHFSNSIKKASRTIPGKVYIYEAMKKKIILGECPANHELFKEDNTHHFVEQGNSDKLVDCILKIFNESGLSR